jgi:AraC-like DNA-binding protein
MGKRRRRLFFGSRARVAMGKRRRRPSRHPVLELDFLEEPIVDFGRRCDVGVSPPRRVLAKTKRCRRVSALDCRRHRAREVGEPSVPVERSLCREVVSLARDMHDPSIDRLLLLDLSGVDVPDRVRAWRQWMRLSFPEFVLDSVALPAEGSAKVMCIGDARLWLMCCPPGRIRRTPDPSSPRDGFVLVNLSGSGSIARDGRVYHIEPHQLCVGRVSRGGAEMSSDEPTRFLLLEIPSSYLVMRYPQLDALEFHMCPRDQPGAAMVRDLLLGAISVGERLGEHERRVTLAAIIELTILPLVGVPSKGAGALRVASTLTQIRARLGEPSLSVKALAQEQGLSRRRLDELFVDAMGSTVAACIADLRMARATELLRDPGCSKLSIVHVAERTGFRDPGHFSRAFKSKFAMTPKAWRERARERSGGG